MLLHSNNQKCKCTMSMIDWAVPSDFSHPIATEKRPFRKALKRQLGHILCICMNLLTMNTIGPSIEFILDERRGNLDCHCKLK